MSKLGPVNHSLYQLPPPGIDGFDSLAELAIDMPWSWNLSTDKILPGAAVYRERASGKGSVSLKMVDWQHTLEKEWPALHFGTAKVETNAGQRVFEIEIYLHELDPAATRVEFYADGVDGGGPVRQEMKRVGQLAGACNGCTYRARVSAARPATDYTARLIPSYVGAAVPLESLRILWQ